MNNKVTTIFILLFCVFFTLPIRAENVTAQIININQDQQIVFIDQGKDALVVGDVMRVDELDHPVYLEVQAVADAVSKLRVSKNIRFYSNVSELENITIGMKVSRVEAKGLGVSLPILKPMASGDAQAFVKPDLTKESIQSIVDRMNTTVDVNVKLSHVLAQCQSDLGDAQKVMAVNEDLKKEVDVLNSKLSEAVLDKDRYQKQAQDLLEKLAMLRSKIDHLTTVIGDR